MNSFKSVVHSGLYQAYAFLTDAAYLLDLIEPIKTEPTPEQIKEDKLVKLICKINDCPAAKELFDQANTVPDSAGAKRNWNIEFVKKIGPKKDDKELMEFDDGKGYKFSLPTGSDACCDSNKRTIYISDELSDRETLGTAIFELTNALQSEKHSAMHDKALKGQISCEDYVEQSETIEFEGCFIAHEIIQQGIKNHKWTILPPGHGLYENLPFYMKDRSEIKNYYERNYKFTAHADYYRQGWERITGKTSDVLIQKKKINPSNDESEKKYFIDEFEKKCLTKLDEKEYVPPISLEVNIVEFSNSRFKTLLSKLNEEIKKREHISNSPKLVEIANMIGITFSCQEDMTGWVRAIQFIQNPALYFENRKNLATDEFKARCAKLPKLQDELFTRIDQLNTSSHLAVKKLIQRIEWINNTFKTENKTLDIPTLLGILGKDTQLVNFCNSQPKDCEKTLTDLLRKHSDRLDLYRELCRKGVSWPHSAELREDIEATGFVFRPMMIRRDRCVCKFCNVEVCGWRPWMDPKSLHDSTKPHVANAEPKKP